MGKNKNASPEYIKELSSKEKKELEATREELAKLQREIITQKSSVCILVDGWENAGKGELISHLTFELDPRYYKVAEISSNWNKDNYNEIFRNFWDELPRKGHITIFDHSIFSRVLNQLNIDPPELDSRLEDLSGFIRMLTDDGMVVIKLFLNLSHKEQKKRIKFLEKTDLRKELLSDLDFLQEEQYSDYEKHFKEILSRTDRLYSPWHIIDMDNLKEGCLSALDIVKKELESGITAYDSLKELNETSRSEENNDSNIAIFPSAFPSQLTQEVSSYKSKLHSLQNKAQLLSYMMYLCHIPTICVFEGMDAAGKGGSIKRLTKEIDPRSYVICTTAAPTEEELSYHYLRRFMTNIPSPGKIAIFDRSWYGRVMVERVEKLAAPREWARAYEEINTMERFLKHIGVNFMKFFLVIDSEEQLKRFEARQNTPEKRWKITEEDWRNRDKWDLYNDAYQEMFYRTSTPTAPWTIVEGNNKKFARLKVLTTFVNQSLQKLRDYEVLHKDKFNWKEFWQKYNSL